MACNCGKPEGTCGCNKDCHASPAVLQINNPAEYATFHKVDVPIAFGDDTEYPPLNGKYKNVILHYEKNGAVYIYSSDGIPTKLTYEEAVEALKKPYISLRRLGSYTYEITFDELPEYRPTNIVAGACSSFVKDGKLYRNFDWHYDEAPTFVVKAKGFTGIANGDKLVDGELDNDIALGQLPYRIVDGYNDNGIMMSTHVLFNDWGWNGAGNKTIQLQKLPYLILTRVKSMATINEDLGSLISNLAGLESEYLLQFVITDGVTTYALLPPQSATGAYELVDITSNPKLTNFRWVANETVERGADYMQNRPTGVERWNEMDEDMSELRFTKAYESNARLSEFIGINGTTKASPDSELQTIYETAHSMYTNRSRNGELWQTVHSVVYSKHGMEHLYTQENWNVDYIADVDEENEINVNDFVYGFDSVADMKSAANLVNGSYARTLGYHSKNDGGSALYKIRNIANDDVVDEMTIIALNESTNTLIAELILEDEMSVKQFGAYGDGINRDQNAFAKALATAKSIIVPEGSYLISKLQEAEGCRIKGVGNATIKIDGENAVTPLLDFANDSITSDLKIECLVDRAWNRGNIANKHNVIIENCSISGFIDSTVPTNAWGLLLTGSKNVEIKSCKFSNNSQSDIALVEGNHNILISDCDDNIKINLEPNNGTTTSDVVIERCSISYLDLQENNYLETSVQNLTVRNCEIDTIRYDGCESIIENCTVKNYEWKPANNIAYAGNLTIINSARFNTKNIIEDQYLDDFRLTDAPWHRGYFPSNIDNSISNDITEDGVLLSLNPNKTSQSCSISYDKISVSAGQSYLLRISSKTEVPASGAGYISLNARVRFYDSTNTLQNTVKVSLNRQTAGTTSKLEENSTIIKIPTDIAYMDIVLVNSDYGTQKFMIKSVELYRIYGNDNKSSNNVPSLPVHTKRVFNSSLTKPSGSGMHYHVGDTMYYNNPSTYIGCVCTAEGTGQNMGTWKDFGAIA